MHSVRCAAKRLVLCLIVGASLSSCCGYQAGSGALVENYATFSIPFAEGDFDGSFTTELARHISQRTGLRYASCGGNLTVHVKLADKKAQSIGFCYGTNSDGDRIDTLVSCEDRLSILAEVWVDDEAQGCTVLGPLYMTASVDYDYEPDTSNVDVVQFSLGQLDFRNGAREAAHRPLYADLSSKIADTISANW